MCYDPLDDRQPIRQGDIFFPLPRPKLSLDEMEAISEDAGSKATNWIDIKDRDKIIVTLELEKSWGIVATQDCDATRSPLISLFQIEPFQHINKTPPTTPKKWVDMLTERACKNASWFYLPKDERFGINERMAVNFHKTFQIQRLDLENNIKLRKGRLVTVAYEHYRESIAQYYRRYPYNEWYSMNKEEANVYVSLSKCDVDDLYSWQK